MARGGDGGPRELEPDDGAERARVSREDRADRRRPREPPPGPAGGGRRLIRGADALEAHAGFGTAGHAASLDGGEDADVPARARQRERSVDRGPLRLGVERGAPPAHPDRRAGPFPPPFAPDRTAVPVEPVAWCTVRQLHARAGRSVERIVVVVGQQPETAAQGGSAEGDQPVGGVAMDIRGVVRRRQAGRKAGAGAGEPACASIAERAVQGEPPLRGAEAALRAQPGAGSPRFSGDRSRERVRGPQGGRASGERESGKRVGVPRAEHACRVIRAQDRHAVQLVARLIGATSAHVHATRRFGAQDHLAAAKGLERVRLGVEWVVPDGGGGGRAVGKRCARVLEAAEGRRRVHHDRLEPKRGRAERHVDRELALARHEGVQHAWLIAEEAHGDVLRAGRHVGERVPPGGIGRGDPAQVGERDDRPRDRRTGVTIPDVSYDRRRRRLQERQAGNDGQ